jgi:ELWxxDGT repeat protein
MRPIFALFAGLTVLAATPARSLTPYLVKEINTNSVPGSSAPQDFVSLGSYTVFTADDGINGPQPWSSNGTLAGTRRLSRCADCLGAPAAFGVLGDAFFFLAAATGAAGETALWVTRGAPASTKQLMQLSVPFTCSGTNISWGFPQQGLIYFSYITARGGCQLWRSDGTVAGTFELADFSSPAATFPEGLIYYAGAVYYGANDGSGAALWKTDGTSRGTELVVRIAANPADSDPGPSLLNVAGSELVFAMDTSARGYELWRSNGTARGTQPLPELVRGPKSPIFYDFLPIGPRLLFVADDGHGQNLWSINGASSGAIQLTHFKSHTAFGEFFTLFPFLLGETTFFRADDGVHGTELWASDGTPGGTRMVSDLCPGPCSSDATPQAIFDGRLLFAADDGTHGSELWTTNGSPSGTRMVSDICPGSCASNPQVVAILGSRALVLADDAALDTELWGTDGTAAGTKLLTPSFVLSPTGGPVVGAAGETLLFQGTDPKHGGELWASDGTRAGTHLLDDINPAQIVDGSYPTDLYAAGSKVFFFATNGVDGEQLWVSDGTAAGTAETSDSATGLDSEDDASRPLAAAAVGETLYFIASDLNFDPAVFKSDGSPGGTVRLTPAGMRPGTEIAAVGTTLFFEADDGVHGPALWKSDGTAAGTVPVDRVSWSGGGALHLTPWNSQLFYFLDAGTEGQLWRTDGTAAGTVQVADLNTGLDDDNALLLTPFGNRLYFFASDASGDPMRLWSTDGTAAGTRQAVTFGLPPATALSANALAVAGNQLFVFLDTGLWVSDGTDAGTHLVSASAFTASPTAVLGNRLVFITPGNSNVPSGLWTSDGTPAGTLPLADGQGHLVAGPDQVVTLGGQLLFSVPSFNFAVPGAVWQSDGTPAGTTQLLTGLGEPTGQELTIAGQRVFFQNNDPVTGNQLWAVQP